MSQRALYHQDLALPLTPAQLARLALRSLHGELVLYPKPGLVSLIDNGSHTDMTAATFVRSLFSLRHYFSEISFAGMQALPFASLKRLAIAAEQRMLRATKGVNTHRGAIFSIGMLCAAIACCSARRIALTPQAIRAALLNNWGEELARHTHVMLADSHGTRVAKQYAASGAREEAALAFPSVFEIALPRLQATLAAGRSWHEAQIDAFFALVAHISDTNLYHRGGAAGAHFARMAAQDFLDAGATAQPDWRSQAVACHRLFVQHRLSPGGAADLLAATCLLQLCMHDSAC
ncbi:triphosphoribosyl-dephospho-CoA synthase MdcB [Undibacterium arcticum]|uniref:Probable 2-(5''-triphosphoribosyl)-3'-dephosphocoenzyme-A synthase n=1 Tax=Undibacterium arcticum TaxID=1762892 RepID=A0ABV7F461_9BURK